MVNENIFIYIFRFKCTEHSSDDVVISGCNVGDILALKINNKTRLAILLKVLEGSFMVHLYEIKIVSNGFCM